MNTETIKTFFDWGALGTLIATLASWLPGVAALLAVIWWAYRIHETRLQVKLLKKQLGEE